MPNESIASAQQLVPLSGAEQRQGDYGDTVGAPVGEVSAGDHRRVDRHGYDDTGVSTSH